MISQIKIFNFDFVFFKGEDSEQRSKKRPQKKTKEPRKKSLKSKEL